MDQMQQAIFLKAVQEVCRDDPSMLRRVIDAATEGVKDFADEQSDQSSKMAFKLFSVLDSVPAAEAFGSFSKREVLEPLERWFGGTPGLKKLKAKFGVGE